MSDTQRHRFADPEERMAAVDSATVIEIGDNLWLDTDAVAPATDFTWDNNLGDTQPQFVEVYAGVALSRSRAGDTDPIRVSVGGIHEFDCASATFESGDLIGVDDNAAPDGLLDQQVIAVGRKGLAIGVVHQREASAVTSVLARIHAPVWNAVDLAPVNISDKALGEPFVIPATYDATAEQHIFDAACPRKIQIIDVWARIATAGGTGATIKLDDGTNDITDALAVGDGTSANDLARGASIDDAYETLSVGDTLDMTTGGTQGSMAGTLYIMAIPVA